MPASPGRKKTSTETVQVSKQRISYARTVLKYAPDQADAVLAGSVSLDEAYRRAQVAEAAKSSRWPA